MFILEGSSRTASPVLRLGPEDMFPNHDDGCVHIALTGDVDPAAPPGAPEGEE